jgi:pimeloyl-ACP methyl ester carboxylesterase
MIIHSSHIKRLRAGDHQLEYVWHGPPPNEAPTLVFLHEGLGCVSMWLDFPRQVAEATGCGALVYSRAGYGNSTRAALPRPVTFMHDEALVTLPQILRATGVQEAILVGHSDGGSIALIYAGSGKADLLRGLVLEAPHVFVEDISVASIRRADERFQRGELRQALQRHHGSNVDEAFNGWSKIWLDPAFRSWNITSYLRNIRVPVLVIQGENDEYGTNQQVEAIRTGCAGKVLSLSLADCGHSPHKDKPARTLEAITSFVLEDIFTTTHH